MAERKRPVYGENMQSVVKKQKVRQRLMHNYSGMGMEQLCVYAKGKAKLMDKCTLNSLLNYES